MNRIMCFIFLMFSITTFSQLKVTYTIDTLKNTTIKLSKIENETELNKIMTFDSEKLDCIVLFNLDRNSKPTNIKIRFDEPTNINNQQKAEIEKQVLEIISKAEIFILMNDKLVKFNNFTKRIKSLTFLLNISDEI